jgi:hypothetical protein
VIGSAIEGRSSKVKSPPAGEAAAGARKMLETQAALALGADAIVHRIGRLSNVNLPDPACQTATVILSKAKNLASQASLLSPLAYQNVIFQIDS